MLEALGAEHPELVDAVAPLMSLREGVEDMAVLREVSAATFARAARQLHALTVCRFAGIRAMTRLERFARDVDSPAEEAEHPVVGGFLVHLAPPFRSAT